MKKQKREQIRTLTGIAFAKAAHIISREKFGPTEGGSTVLSTVSRSVGFYCRGHCTLQIIYSLHRIIQLYYYDE